jgi:hypothetical protein
MPKEDFSNSLLLSMTLVDMDIYIPNEAQI